MIESKKEKEKKLSLSEYLKTKPIVKIDNILYNGPLIIKSESNHLFEIYEEIKNF